MAHDTAIVPEPKKKSYVPLWIYVFLALLSIITSFFTGSIVTIVGNLIFILLWGFLIWLACHTGHTGVAWGLLIVPFLIWLLLVILSVLLWATIGITIANIF